MLVIIDQMLSRDEMKQFFQLSIMEKMKYPFTKSIDILREKNWNWFVLKKKLQDVQRDDIVEKIIEQTLITKGNLIYNSQQHDSKGHV